LLVDDNATSRRVLRRQLEAWGIEVSEAGNAGEALEAVKRAPDDPFDVTLIDQQMPVLDGLGIARGLRALRGGEDLPIVMLSSMVTRIAAEDIASLGIAATLTKPIHQSPLLDCLTSLFSGTYIVRTLESDTNETPTRPAELGKRVLVVEDNPVNQAVARGLLEQLGCDVTSAYNGREALEIARARSFDVILMDCQMPEMDGFSATDALRRWESERGGPRTPIVALTANAMAGYRDRCIAAGMDDYLAKPFKLAQLREVLERQSPAIAQPGGDGAHSPTRASATLPDSHALDRAALDALRSLPGQNGNLLERVIGVYLDSSGELVQRIEQALRGTDRLALRTAAHALKSSSANVGALALARLCQRTEDLADGTNFDGAREAARLLLGEYSRVIAALRDESALMQGGAA
jgi:CheY-like chemotaxis protein